MKKIVVILLLVNIALAAQAQKKNVNVSFMVNGVCNMCKKRIEKAAIQVKGVKFANWNIKTKQLKVVMDQRKTDVISIQKAIAKVGHDSKNIIANDKAYNSLHFCCLYRDK